MKNDSEPSAVITADEPRFRLYSLAEVLDFPEQRWLIDEVIHVGKLGVLYGLPESGKSFLAIDWALSIATGEQWQGRDVMAGPVVYVAGEGRSGIAPRLGAWLQKHDVTELPKAFMLFDPPYVVERESVEQLLGSIRTALAEEQPRLIVLDTLACCFGLDENSAKDMNLFVAGCRRLTAETGATILVVHHSGKNGGPERGSGALRGAADVMIAVERNGSGRFALKNDKQKDAERFKPRAFTLEQVTLKNGTSSCVIAEAPYSAPKSADRLHPSLRHLIQVLASLDVAKSGEWAKVADVGANTFPKQLAKLKAAGLVEEVPEAPHHYRLTDEGKKEVSDASAGTQAA